MLLKELYGRLFGRRPPIADLASLADFIDAQSAFLVQKGIYEYSRARAGHYSKVLFGEPQFREAVETSRWRAYPLGLAMVGELVEGVLRPQNQDRQRVEQQALKRLVLAVFDRYPLPAGIGADAWREARDELAGRLDRIGLHPVKPAMDIPEQFAKSYFALMPIHKSLRGSDFPTLHSYLKITMCNIHDELKKRADIEALRADLGAGDGRA